MTVDARMSGALASATGTITIDLTAIAGNWTALAAKVRPAQ
jgi:alanine racemase